MNARVPTVDWLSQIVQFARDGIERAVHVEAARAISTIAFGRLLQLYVEGRISTEAQRAAHASIESAEADRVRTIRAREQAARAGIAPANPLQVAA